MKFKSIAKFRSRDEESQEQQGFLKKTRRIKEALFDGIISTLEAEANAYVFPFVMNFLMWMQIITMPFSEVLGGIWGEGGFPNALRTTFRVLEIRTLLESSGFFYFSIGLYVTIIIIAMACFVLYATTNLHFFRKVKPESILQANKLFILLLMKIFMLPFFSILFLSLKCHKNDDGELVLANFDSVHCFQGMHLINFILSIVFSLLYLGYGLIISMLYFETNADRRLVQGSQPSYCWVLLFLFIAKFSLVNIISVAQEQEYFALAILLIGNIGIFNQFYTNNPFYDKGIKGLTKVMVAVSFWSVITAFFAKTLSQVTYDDPIILWALGVPLIIAIVLLNPEKQLGLLLTDLTQIKDCRTISRQQNYLLYLWQNRDCDKYNGVVLDGFIAIHQQSCEIIECPIRKAAASAPTSKFKPETYEVILLFIEFNFQTAIAKFPSNVDLRINYILFLEKWAARYPDILSQLNVLQSLSTTFYTDFFVYKYTLKTSGRLKSSTKNAAFTTRKEVNEGQKEPQAMVNFIQKMESCCVAYMKFWNHLCEDFPDHHILKLLGREIQQITLSIDKSWKTLQFIPLHDRIKMMMLYGNFLKHIMNKSTTGDQMLMKARELLAIQRMEAKSDQPIDLDLGLTDLSTASILISGNLDNIGEILKANSAALIMFGYGPKELSGFNVKTIIPNTFNMHHDAYIEKAVTSKSVTKLASDRFMLGLSKNGYLVPLHLSIKPIFSPFLCFVGNLKPYRQMHITGFVLTDFKGRIESVSPAMVQLFEIDSKAIAMQPFLGHYFPGMFEERDYYINRGEGVLPAKYDNAARKKTEQSSYKYLIDVSRHQHWLMIKEYYVFKFTKVEERDLGNSANKNELSKNRQHPKTTGFEFWIEPEKWQVFGRHYKSLKNDEDEVQVEQMDMIDQSEVEFGTRQPMSSKFDKQQYNTLNYRRPVYNAHQESSINEIEDLPEVKVFKLDNGKIVELENVTDEEEEKNNAVMHSRDETRQLRRKQENDEESQSIIQNIQSNRLMKQFITKTQLPRLFIITFIIINVFFITALASASNEYTSKTMIIDRTMTFHSLFAHYSTTLNEYQNLADAIIQLVAQPKYETNSTRSEATLKNYVVYTIMSLESLNDAINEDLNRLNDPTLYNATIYSNLTMYNLNKVFYSTEYTKSLKQILAQASIVKDQRLDKIVFKEQSAVYFTLVNILNDGWALLYDKAKIILNTCNNMLMDQFAFKLHQVVTASALAALICMFWFLIKMMNRHATRNLNLFLDIANSEIKRYINNCEFFITNIHTNSLDQANFDDLEGTREVVENENLNIRRGRRESSIKLKIPLSFYLKFLLMAGIPVALSIWLYLSHETATNDLIQLSAEALSMSTLGSYYHMLSSTLLLQIIDVKARINPPFNFTLDDAYLAKAFRKDSEFYNSLLENTRLHSDVYQNTINSLMNSHFCDIQELQDSYDTGFYPLGEPALCLNKTKSWGLEFYLGQGFRAGFAYFQDSIYDIYNQLVKFQSSANKTDPISAFLSKNCTTAQDYAKFCMFSYPNIQKNYLYQNIYLDLLIKFMMNHYKNDLSDHIVSSIKSNAAGIFSFFIISMVAGYFLVVLKTFWDVRRDYFLVQQMVLMVPLSSIRYSRYIKDFFKDHMSRMLR